MEPSSAFRAAVYAAGGPPCDLETVEPTALLRALRRHKLVAHAQRLEGLTAAQKELLRPAWRAGSASALAHASERDRVLAALRADHIPCLAYKGVVLQEWLAGKADGRDSEDLDLWVPPLLFRRVVRWALADGYTLAFEWTEDDVNAPVLPSELLLLHPSGMHLDLHQAFFAPHYALDAAQAYFESFASDAEAGFDDVATTLMVAIGAGKDAWSTLRHLADLADALQRVDGAELAAVANRTHTRLLLDTGVHLVRTVLEQEVVWTFAHPVRPGADVALRAENPLALPQRGRVYARSRERAVDRLTYAARLPFKVSALDVHNGPTWMPRAMRRAVGLLRRHGGNALASALSGSTRRRDG